MLLIKHLYGRQVHNVTKHHALHTHHITHYILENTKKRGAKIVKILVKIIIQ